MRISDWSSDVCSSDLESLEVSVTTDDGKPAGHLVIFNRAVAASQAFGRQFPDLDKLLSRKENKTLPIEKWPAKPREWLDRKSVVEGKSVSVRVDFGGRRSIKKKKKYKKTEKET